MKKVLEGTKRVLAMLMVVLMVFGLVPATTVETLAEDGQLTPNTLAINIDESKGDVQVVDTTDETTPLEDGNAEANIFVYQLIEGHTYKITIAGKTIDEIEEVVYGVYNETEKVELLENSFSVEATAGNTGFSYDVKFVSDATTKVTVNYKSSEITSVSYDNGIAPETTETGVDKTSVFSVLPGENVNLVAEPAVDGAAVVSDKGTPEKNGEENSYIVALGKCEEDTVVNLTDDMIQLEVTAPDTVENTVVYAGDGEVAGSNGKYNIKKGSESYITFESELPLKKLVAKVGTESKDVTEVSEGIYKIVLGSIAEDMTLAILEKEFPKVTVNYPTDKVDSIKVTVDGNEVTGADGKLEFNAEDSVTYTVTVNPKDEDAIVAAEGYTVNGTSGERTFEISNVTTATTIGVNIVDVYTLTFEGVYGGINVVDGSTTTPVVGGELKVREDKTNVKLQIVPGADKYISELQIDGEKITFTKYDVNAETFAVSFVETFTDDSTITVSCVGISTSTKSMTDVLSISPLVTSRNEEGKDVYYINKDIMLEAKKNSDLEEKYILLDNAIEATKIISGDVEYNFVYILTQMDGYVDISKVNFNVPVKFVVDNGAPVITVDSTKTTEFYGPNMRDVLITGSVSDTNLDKVVYFTTQPVGEEEIFSVSAPTVMPDLDGKFEINIEVPYEEDIEDYKDTVTYYVYAIDYAGNISDAEEIIVNFDNKGPSEGSIKIVNETKIIEDTLFLSPLLENMPVLSVKLLGFGDNAGVAKITVSIFSKDGTEIGTKEVNSIESSIEFTEGIVDDGIYQFKIVAIDKVGNESVFEISEIEIESEKYTQFSYDGTAPSVIVTPVDNSSENGVYVPNESICYINGADLRNVYLNILVNDYLVGNEVTPYISGLANTTVKIGEDIILERGYSDEYIDENININLEAIISNDGEYPFTIIATDNVGNRYETTYIVVVDSVAPSLSVKVNNENADLGDEFVSYKFFTNTLFTITFNGMDGSNQTADSKVSHYVVEYLQGTNIVRTETVTGNVPSFTNEITDNFKGTIRVTVFDNVGNKLTKTLKNGLIFEKENTHASNAGVTLTTQPTSMTDINGIKLYANDTDVSVVVTDTYAGIKAVNWKIEAPFDKGNNISDGFEISKISQRTDWKAETTENGIVTKVSGTIPVSNNSNNITVEVTITDNAGNTSTSSVVVSIDKTTPTINVSVAGDDADSQYTSTFNGDRGATITIRERNFKSSDVKVTITNTDGVIPSVTTWTKKEDASNPDNNTYTATVTFAADGDYTLDVAYTDLAKRVATAPAQQKLTIDKTAPAASVSIDGNASNGHYFASGRTATIVINEHNFDSNRVQLTGTATNNGASVSIPSISSWSTSGDTHTATIRFTEDADYQLVLSGIDQAGNTFTYEVPNFVIDQVLPTITISGVENQSANAGDVVPVITLGDVNYDANGVNITLVGANNGSMELSGSFSDTADGQVFTFSNFPNEKEYDDIYTLTATKTDMAGNETVETITFSVNRFGSVYTFSDELKEVVGKYVKQPFEIVLTETNIDRLDPASIKVVLTVNGTPKTLVLDVDYTISQSGSDASWKQYVYTINPSVFEGDGSYSLALYSVDSAGNVNENINEVKEAEVIFGIDSTAPVVEAINFENGFTNETAYTATISAIDNIIMKAVKVLINGEAVEVTQDGDMYTFVIPESGSRQTVTVIATDEAGNETRMEYTDILITSNVFVSFFNNTPLLIGSIAGVAAVGGGAGAFVFFRRRNVVKIKK